MLIKLDEQLKGYRLQTMLVAKTDSTVRNGIALYNIPLNFRSSYSPTLQSKLHELIVKYVNKLFML